MTAPQALARPVSNLSPETLWEMDRRHVLHPWANFGPFEAEGSLVIERGEGAWLWDAWGKRYLDAVARRIFSTNATMYSRSPFTATPILNIRITSASQTKLAQMRDWAFTEISLCRKVRMMLVILRRWIKH